MPRLNDDFTSELCKEKPDWKKILPLKPDHIELPEVGHAIADPEDPYHKLYRQSGDFSEYIDKIHSEGLDEETATLIYQELNEKYAQ